MHLEGTTQAALRDGAARDETKEAEAADARAAAAIVDASKAIAKRRSDAAVDAAADLLQAQTAPRSGGVSRRMKKGGGLEAAAAGLAAADDAALADAAGRLQVMS